MKKLVPDPPQSPLPSPLADRTTQAIVVAPDSLFAVQPGIAAEIALDHLWQLLKSAQEICDEVTEQGSGVEPGLIGALVHNVEMGLAVVAALRQPSDISPPR